MYFVVNPAAGRGRGRKTLDRLQPLLRPDDTVAVSEGPGHCQRLAAEAATQHPAVTVVGGDGTVCEVINGIAEAGFTAALGILPVGTPNDLASGLSIPRDFDRALAIVRAGNVHPVDLGLIVRGPPKAERYFVTTVGAGINALIASQAQAETDKAVGSPIVYIGAAARMILRYSPVPVEIEAGEFALRGPILMMSVSNVAKEGGLFWLAPKARPDDGFLHLLIWSDVPLWLRQASREARIPCREPRQVAGRVPLLGAFHECRPVRRLQNAFRTGVEHGLLTEHVRSCVPHVGLQLFRESLARATAQLGRRRA